MPLRRSLVAPAFALAVLALSNVASAEIGPVQRFLRGPLLPARSSALRIVPPAGGHVLLHREGKPARWFLQPGLVTVEPGVPYAITAVRDGEVLFDSGVVARPGLLSLTWEESATAPRVSFQPPVAWNPLAAGLFPASAVPMQALRSPIGSVGFASLLDELQSQPDEPSRWLRLVRYADGFLFTDEQIRTLVGSFAFPLYRGYASVLLARRRIDEHR